MNEHQIKNNVLAYCKRNGKINDREINSMMIPTKIIKELVNENQLVEIKQGVYQIFKVAKFQSKGLF
mgnify:FL=1